MTKYNSHSLKLLVYLLLALLMVFTNISFAGKRYHMIEQNKKSTIDWTEKSIFSTGIAPFSINKVREHHKNNRAALRDAKKEFVKAIISIFINSESSVKIAMQYKANWMDQIINVLPKKSKIFIPPTSKHGITTVTQKTLLTGSGSFLNMISNFYPIKKVFPPPFNRINHVTDYSGIVIDCRNHTNFKPAIGLKIYSEDGEIIYSPAFTKRNIFIRQGHITYYNKPKANLLKKIVGTNFLYIIPKSLKGSNNSDIVLYNRDIDKFISSKKTLKELTECKLVIIANSFKNKY